MHSYSAKSREYGITNPVKHKTLYKTKLIKTTNDKALDETNHMKA